jgi:4-oxalomesaconate tautomerase
MGAGHKEQITGLGGSRGVSSKVCIVGLPRGPEEADLCDVRYLFRQVEVESCAVDASHGDCGNMIAAVACFAVERGLLSPSPGHDETTCRVLSDSTGAIFHITVKTPGGHLTYSGDALTAGVPGSASPIAVKTLRPAGLTCGSMLPTGQPRDTLTLSSTGVTVSVSCIDVSRPMVFVAGDDVRVGACSATVADLDADADVQSLLEDIRLMAASAMGMGDCKGKASPKICTVGPPATAGGAAAVRYSIAPYRSETHPALAMTAGQCLAAAALIRGSVVADVCRLSSVVAHQTPDGTTSCRVPFEHPRGIVDMLLELTPDVSREKKGALAVLPDAGNLLTTGYNLTAAPIAEGVAFID